MKLSFASKIFPQVGRKKAMADLQNVRIRLKKILYDSQKSKLRERESEGLWKKNLSGCQISDRKNWYPNC